MSKSIYNSNGFSLMEVIISIFIISVLMLGMYSLIILSIQINAENSKYVQAIEIANLKMESIRNMSYDDIGTASGTPQRGIPDYETIYREGTYNVHTTIVYYDDEFDGTLASGTDLVLNDYKIATVEVSWGGQWGSRNITMFSKIIPNTEETPEGLGLIKIEVVDATGGPVPTADVHIENPGLGVAVDLVADNKGKLYYPVEPDFEAWEITVSKPGYGIDKTYARDAINLNPTKPHLSVNIAASTEQNFSIDQMSILDIKTVTNSLPSNWKANEDIDNDDKGSPHIGVDNSNNMYIVWQKYNSTSSEIFLQKFNSSATKIWASDKQISTTQFQYNPDIVTTQAGISYIVWQDNSTFLKNTARAPTPTKLARVNQVKQNNSFSESLLFVPHYFNSFSTPGIIKSSSKTTNFHNIYKKTQKLFSTEYAYAAGNVSFVGSGAIITTGDTNNITLPVPGGVQPGDLLIAFIHHDNFNDGPIQAPGGFSWNILNDSIHPSGSRNNHRGAILWKFAIAGDPNNYTFSMSGGNEQKAGMIRAYRNVDTVDPFSSTLLISSTPYGNLLRPAPSNTVAQDGSMLLCGWGSDTPRLANVSGGPIFPAGMTNSDSDYSSEIGIASADLAVNISDSPTGAKNYDANRWVNRRSFDWSLVIQPAAPIDVSVTDSGSQNASLLIPSTDEEVGGMFILTDSTGSHTVTGITITESGSTNAEDELKNIRLFYDADTSAPYDCAGEIYNAGLDSQFGGTEDFLGANGIASFTDVGALISTTRTLCIYTVLDITATATKDTTLELSINDPSTDVILAAGSVTPNTPVEISGTTDIQKPAEPDQIHYRWRDDNGDEATADWLEVQDTPTTITQDTPIRLRIEITNNGSLDTASIPYQLEYGEQVTTCDAIAAWTIVPNDNSAHWRMTDTANLTENNPTTNIAGLTDENSSFEPGATKDISSQTNGIVLASDDFTEIEYAIKATSNSSDSVYCFRLTNSGSTNGFVYSTYPQISVIGDDNIFIISYNSSGNENWAVKKVNSNMGSSHQRYPRLALTENFGTATTVVVWQDQQNGNWDIYAQSFAADGTKAWVSELQITNSANDEYSPAIAIDNNDNFIVSWVEDDSGNEEIYLHKFNLSGVPVWAAAKKVVSTAVDEYDPELAIDSSNNIYLSYTNTASGSKNIYIEKYNSSGINSWSVRGNLESIDDDQSESDIGINGSDLYASWTDTRDGDDDIYVQKYDLNGSAQWSEDVKINITLTTTNQAKSSIIINSLNSPFGVWQDGRQGSLDIYATEFFDPGSLTSVANVPFILTGTKQIGDSPVIYEYEHYLTTDGTGELNIPVEYDTPGYSLELNPASTSLSIILRDPVQPLEVSPNSIVNWTIYVE